MLVVYLIVFSTFLFSQADSSASVINTANINEIEINEDFLEDNLFEQLLTESKLFYADAIMSDLQGDSLNALNYFDSADKLAKTLLEGFALGLNLKRDFSLSVLSKELIKFLNSNLFIDS